MVSPDQCSVLRGCDQRQRDQTSFPHNGFNSGGEGPGDCACVPGPGGDESSEHVGVKDVLKVRYDLRSSILVKFVISGLLVSHYWVKYDM